MGDFKGKVIVAPTGILRSGERTLQDQRADHLQRIEELNRHKSLIASLRERLSPEQLNSLITGPPEQSTRGESQRSTSDVSSSPAENKFLDVSPPQLNSLAVDPDDSLATQPSVPSVGRANLRGKSLASFLSIIRTSLVMEGLLVSGPNGLQPKPKQGS